MEKLRALAEACGPSLVDVHADADHHRSVFTLAGPGARDACDGARALAAAVAEHLTIVDHSGEHPRFGALDVVPFVALGGTNAERASAAEAARAFGELVGHDARRAGVPVRRRRSRNNAIFRTPARTASSRASPTTGPARRTRRSARPRLARAGR